MEEVVYGAVVFLFRECYMVPESSDLKKKSDDVRMEVCLEKSVKVRFLSPQVACERFCTLLC